ncbi:MAG: acyl--CoA ligase, partial [Actinomycetia bacterium]|nr:acyl--CoA ligase [Actinomycetes bacterium]
MVWRHAEIRTLADVPHHWARTTPDATALVDPVRTVTYAELDVRSDRIAAAIAGAGIAPGSHIGYLAQNSAEFFEVWFGAVKAGCALAPFNWRSTEAELIELVEDARCSVFVTGPKFADAAHRVGAVAGVDVVDLGAGLDAWLERFAAPAAPAVRIHPDDTALLAYTSGTTGRPKGAQLSHRAVAAWFLIASLEPTETWSSDDIALMVMPSYHLAGSWVSLP